MTVYVLSEIREYEHCPILGVYTTVELAKSQVPNATWTQNNTDSWVGSYRISSWSEQSYAINPWDVDQSVDPEYIHPLYVPTPEEVAADVARAALPFRRGIVSSIGFWGISASVYYPDEPIPEYQASLKVAEAMNKAQAERYAKPDDTTDWKTRFDELIKKVTEF